MDEPSVQPCWLLKLPQELLFCAVDHIDLKRDLYNFSRTCKALEDVCLRRLYAQVNIEVPKEVGHAWKASPLSSVRPHVAQVVRDLRICNGTLENRRPTHNRKHVSGASTVDIYVEDLVEQVPMNQLRTFTFLSTSPLGPRVLQSLANRHCQSLRAMSIYEYQSPSGEDVVLPNKLTSLECYSIQDGRTISKLLNINRSSLVRLRLGQERELLQQYSQTRVGYLQLDVPHSTLFRSTSLHHMPNLRQLELCGVDVAPLVPLETKDALFFCNLTKLTLESCPGSVSLLQCLASTFHFVQASPQAPTPKPVIQLRDFVFRSESPTSQLKEALLFFLDSFAGLKMLSLLFENATILERVSTLLCDHGPTLQTLVLESRIQPRDNLGLDTSRPFGAGGYSQELWEQSINDICQLCPNLVNLGMGFPWNDEVVRLRKTRLPTLAHLKTIHVRNFPENRALSQIGDYTIKEYATKFVDWVFPTLVGGHAPALETLAIGPTIYESRWKTSTTRRQPLEFQRTHYYGVDWAMTRFGRWSSMVSPVSEKYMEEVRGETPLAGVFEQVWLK